ncbi:hypothetical protein [Paenibacillus methanolicus]|uniref:Hpr(Ser) kinase/phosphatase n=1 Tax=Paenibacillus methanolicus TaxID=582686 RepID=A0A5S5BPN6_9BACL|nr:hypothetical protein [Paenibacillus methanolicus]TYP69145.1 hypothetical protein BCM02_11621 [Paenibacillus methanolicus]
MSKLNIAIGEFIWALDFQSEDIADLFRNTFSDLGKNDGSAELSIRLSSGFGAPFLSYELDESIDEEGHACYTRSDYELRVDSAYKQASMRVHDGLALKHAFMQMFSLYAVYTGWGLLMHASCVRSRSEAHIFTGPSGAGKSTAAALSSPRGIYADEAALVKIGPDGATVFHSPFRSDLHTGIADQLAPGPLSSVHLLRQSADDRRVPVPLSDAVLAMMRTVFYWNPTPASTRFIMLKLGELARSVPVYELYFRKEPTFWELIE